MVTNAWRDSVFVAIGSDVDPETNIPRALAQLHERFPIQRLSTFYRTQPMGREVGPDFYNGVCEIARPTIGPRTLKFETLRHIESDLGRSRGSDVNSPRPIDLDILLWGELIVQQGDLFIPDPAINDYPFLSIPLHELEPNLQLPTGRFLKPIADAHQQQIEMIALPKFSKKMRQALHLATL